MRKPFATCVARPAETNDHRKVPTAGATPDRTVSTIRSPAFLAPAIFRAVGPNSSRRVAPRHRSADASEVLCRRLGIRNWHTEVTLRRSARQPWIHRETRAGVTHAAPAIHGPRSFPRSHGFYRPWTGRRPGCRPLRRRGLRALGCLQIVRTIRGSLRHSNGEIADPSKTPVFSL